MEKNDYVIAVKQSSAQSAPADWKHQLAEIDGVSSVVGDLPHLAQFTATPDAIDHVKQQFSSLFHIESIANRTAEWEAG